MTSYYIEYTIKDKVHEITVYAKDVKSAKKKIGRKHGYKSGNMIKITKVYVIGYY